VTVDAWPLARRYPTPVTASDPHWVITLRCTDRPGIVHAVSGAIVAAGGNITESMQFYSADTDTFFMRVQVALAERTDLETELAAVRTMLDAQIEVDEVGRPMRTLVLVSKAGHVLNDLLFAHRSGSLPVDIPLILGNHDELAPLAAFYGIPFEHHEVAPATKPLLEDRIRRACEEHDIELVVLARYMQILSPELCAYLAGRAINIHHSFLPGFKGANPYRQAHARGVKLIGATAHFVTTELDEGPIIEQNVTRVSHSRTVPELVELGQDIESRTLVSAVKLFAQHRVLLDGQRTIIFD
jgi:formyltetrahydrofolate deformylase